MNQTLKTLTLLLLLLKPLVAQGVYGCSLYSIESKSGEEKIVYGMHEGVTIVEDENGSLWVQGALFTMLTATDKHQFTKTYDNFAGGVRYLSENYIIDIVDCTRIDEHNNTQGENNV